MHDQHTRGMQKMFGGLQEPEELKHEDHEEMHDQSEEIPRIEMDG